MKWMFHTRLRSLFCLSYFQDAPAGHEKGENPSVVVKKRNRIQYARLKHALRIDQTVAMAT